MGGWTSSYFNSMGGAEGEGRLQCARRCFFFLLWSNLTKEEWDSEALTLPRTQVVSHKYREGMSSKENKKKDDCHLLLRLLFPTAKVRGKLKGKNNSKKERVAPSALLKPCQQGEIVQRVRGR